MQGQDEIVVTAYASRGDQKLEGLKVLVTEDDLFVAMDLAETFEAAGAKVIGPVSSTGRAMQVLKHDLVHAAVLDISLGDDLVFPLAEMLADRKVPFVFASGCDKSIIPDKFSRTPLCEKPFEPCRILAVLADLID